ncbi:hypothetical protein SAE02_77680 [Skermanella aerolata]|uniref:Uncharacterized protein n=1 Tax=Skermanella aerolata TaxID=393310 RepID=A0A512E560_9PROT|nr:hypothetical protein [Skermanella aerolata]KJB90842.1 hypothetical protein N826_34180 [Skermanella aerolata KACC 11604]GEO43620.1 hypothetical protein SAE02_77680 [Skermanella aerolata]
MSKFSKPKQSAQVSEADIQRVIGGAEANDDRKAEQKPDDQGEVRFTMTLTGAMAGRVERAREGAGGMTRLAWIRLAVAEKLAREGV